MKTLVLKKRDLDLKEYIKRSAREKDYETLIEEPTILIDADDGQVKIIYDILDLDTAPIVTEHALVTEFAITLEDYYRKYHPEGYAAHLRLAEEKVKSAYRIQGKSAFTSGIINKNNPLKYHFDTGNFKDVYSCMVVFKGGGVEGGYLSCPEYGVGFKLPNNSLFLFDGQSILHGVTPIKYQSRDSYRYSIVYYSLKRMWQCLTIDEELARVRKKKTERERTRMDNPLTEAERQLKEKKRRDLVARRNKQ